MDLSFLSANFWFPKTRLSSVRPQTSRRCELRSSPGLLPLPSPVSGASSSTEQRCLFKTLASRQRTHETPGSHYPCTPTHTKWPALSTLCAQCFPTPLAGAKEWGGRRLSMDPRVSRSRFISCLLGQQTLLWKQSPQQQVPRGPKKEQSFRTAAMGRPSLRAEGTQRPHHLGSYPQRGQALRGYTAHGWWRKHSAPCPQAVAVFKGWTVFTPFEVHTGWSFRGGHKGRKGHRRFSRNGAGTKDPEGTGGPLQHWDPMSTAAVSLHG